MKNILKKVSNFFHRSKVVACLILIPLFSSCILFVWFSEQSAASGEVQNLKEGMLMPRNVYAEFDFRTTDLKGLALKRKCEAFKVPRYYRIDAGMTGALAEKFKEFFKSIPPAEPDVSKYIDRKNSDKIISDVTDHVLRKGILADGRGSDPSVWYTQETLDLVPALCDERRTPKSRVCDMVGGTFREFEAPLTVREAAEQAAVIFVPDRKISDETLRGRVRTALAGIFTGYLSGGNLTPDVEKTAKDTAEALARIREDDPRFVKIFKSGERIAEKDQELTACDTAYLNAYCRQLKKSEAEDLVYRRFIKISLCLLLILATVLYIRHIGPEITRDNKNLLVLGFITIVSLLVNWGFASAFRFASELCDLSPKLLFLALPLSLPAVVTSVIYGLRPAVYISLFISGITAVVFDNSFAVLVTGILSGFAAGFDVCNVSNYKRFFGQALFGTLLVSVIAGAVLLCRDFRPDYMWNWVFLRNAASLCCCSSFLTTLAAAMLLAFLEWEWIFGVATNMRYLTVIDRNNELLKKLQRFAPGTYTHSSDVEFIAEIAAKTIGANSLRLQAYAFYHDIGKLEAPANFTENNPPENPHEKLSPKESAEKIRHHVSDGLSLARKYALDSTIRDAIEQHHGTDFIGSFYMKAKELDPENPPDEADFRYAGPLPQSKEIVLLCLADCAEAISRGLPKTGNGKESYEEMLARKLDEVIIAKLKKGQFSEANMTLKELHLVRDAIISTLVGLHHDRKAEYPSSSGKKESAK